MQHSRKLTRLIALTSLPAALLLSWVPTASAITINSGQTLNLSDTQCTKDAITNYGTLNISGDCRITGDYINYPGAVTNIYGYGLTIYPPGTGTNQGTINLLGGDLYITSLTNASGGLINVASGNLEIFFNFNNQGTIKLGCGGSLAYYGNFTGNLPVDACAPSVTINQAADQSDPTTSLPINFTVVFSEDVTGFTESDVTINGPAGATATVTGSGKLYNVAVSGMTAFGTVFVDIKAGAAQDAAGNLSTASTSTDKTVSYSKANTAPTADAGADQSFQANKKGVLVTLNGTLRMRMVTA
jgi:hypothetical protein